MGCTLLASNFDGLIQFLVLLAAALFLMLATGTVMIRTALRQRGARSSRIKMILGATLVGLVLAYIVFVLTNG